MSIGENIRKLRKKQGLTQKELGELCSPPINEANIRKYELGRQIPKIGTINRIANALNVNIDDIIDDFKASPSEFLADSDLITPKDERDIKKDLDNIMDKIATGTDGPLFFDGEEMSPESLELFQDELKIALRRLKLINKEKYNPRKNADPAPAEPPANEGRPPAGADPRQGNAKDNNQDNE